MRRPRPARVAGVDGCPGGWIMISASLDPAAPDLRAVMRADFTDLMATQAGSTIVAVDMPVGLLDSPVPGGRDCDRQARRLLPGRSSSVFSAPARVVLNATDFDDVRGNGLNLQTFNLLPQIRAVDAWITPGRQRRAVEAHPELALAMLAGKPIPASKKTQAGRMQRLAVLRAGAARAGCPLFTNLPAWLEVQADAYLRRDVGRDDWIDACACLWVAWRFHSGMSQRVPDEPPRDARGLRMEIWY